MNKTGIKVCEIDTTAKWTRNSLCEHLDETMSAPEMRELAGRGSTVYVITDNNVANRFDVQVWAIGENDSVSFSCALVYVCAGTPALLARLVHLTSAEYKVF